MTATSINDSYRRPEELVWLVVETPTTAQNGYTLDVDLGSYGIAEDGLLGIQGWGHTTENSVVVGANAEPTTSVSSGTLTITLDSNIGTKKRVFLILGRSEV